MYILAIDQSTAATKAILFSADGKAVCRADVSHRQITNDLGWVEHDPNEIFANTILACKMVVDKIGISANEIKSVGISNQRETAVCWDKNTGEPICNAIVWQCGRASTITERIAQTGKAAHIEKTTGLKLSPYFSAAKFAWILDNVDGARKKQDTGRLCFGNIDAWLLFKLTGGFKTDWSNASRTQLLNLDTLKWDEEVAALFSIDISALPRICDSDSIFGYTDLDGFLNKKIPICAVMGDSHAALYANGCTAKATFGTGTSVMMKAGKNRPPHKQNGLVESLAWGIDGDIEYVLEGNINYSGAIIKWLAEDVELIRNVEEAGELASTVSGTNGVYLVPAFSGLGAPYWNNNVRGVICGLNQSTKKAHLVRAGLEAISYQIKDIVEELNTCCNASLTHLAVDGGATSNPFLMQFTADILDISINISAIEELSAAGVAYLAAIRSGVSTYDMLFSKPRHRQIKPTMEQSTRENLYRGWKEALSRLIM